MRLKIQTPIGATHNAVARDPPRWWWAERSKNAGCITKTVFLSSLNEKEAVYVQSGNSLVGRSGGGALRDTTKTA
jgi:hypothetical protein